MYDNLGQKVFEREILKGQVSEVFDFQGLVKGMYFYEVREGDLKIGAGKVVLID